MLDGSTVIATGIASEEKAAFIVRACNGHEDLVKSLGVVVWMEQDRDPDARNFEDERLEYFDSLIKKARGR